MKTFTTIFMGLVIFAGLILALTPFVADKFFPVPENTIRQAKPEAAAMALKQWFQSADGSFMNVQAINKTNTKTSNRTSWFSFSVGRGPIEKYIIAKKLVQTELSLKDLETVFFTNKRPVSWWQPEAIKQQTYFSGEDQGRKISLIYNPKSKRGVLVTTRLTKELSNN